MYAVYIYTAVAYIMTMWLKHIYCNHMVKVVLDILDILLIFSKISICVFLENLYVVKAAFTDRQFIRRKSQICHLNLKKRQKRSSFQ